MQSLDLNLSSRPFRNNTLLWSGYSSALVLLVAFAVWNVTTWRSSVTNIKELSDEVSSIEGRLSDLEQRDLQAARGIAGYDVGMLAVQAEKANEVIDWKAFSWTRLFNLMEQVLPYDVRMSSIRPLFHAGRHRGEMDADAQRRAQTVPVSVEGLAKDFRAVWEMQNALLADSHFGRVFPERLQRTERGEIVFSITFLYHPDVVIEEALVAEISPVPEEEAEAGPEGQAVEAEGAEPTAPGDLAGAESPPEGTGGTEPAPLVDVPAEGSELAEEEGPGGAAKVPAARANQAAASEEESAAARAERVRHSNQSKRLLRRAAERPSRPTAAKGQEQGAQTKGRAGRTEGDPTKDPAKEQEQQKREPE